MVLPKGKERKVRTMSDWLVGVCFVGGFMGGLVLLCFIISKSLNLAYDNTDKKHRKEHPEFFCLYDEFNEKDTTACRFYNKEVVPLKRKVDAILKEEPYWPQEVREQKMEELEEIRRKIYIGECMYKGLDKETKEARKKVADYVHSHNIKWAGNWD